ncbi:MAG: hypothetical protein KME29_26230 [Calothrix sp. FI2-JRJ7]|jgi:hypothetical protein|nr:hypothetical protein [Calothrix sp. FI2-JRJ7]
MKQISIAEASENLTQYIDAALTLYLAPTFLHVILIAESVTTLIPA